MLTDILLQVPVDETIAKTGLDALLKLAGKIGLRLIIDFVSVFVLIRFIYYRIYKNNELLFTYLIFNIVIFFICYLLNKVELSMGAAFGLFAVFSMLRYRTEGISIKDMTYLFLVIAMGLISAITKIKDADDIYENMFIVVVNSILILITYLLESNLFFKRELSKSILYEKIDLVRADRYNDLLIDLKDRTGLPITRVVVTKIDFLKDAALVKVYYFEGE
jgi:hypothetical protein